MSFCSAFIRDSEILKDFLVEIPRENGNLARGRRMDVNARQRTFAMRIASVGSRTPLTSRSQITSMQRVIKRKIEVFLTIIA